jgi:hypothetical protein
MFQPRSEERSKDWRKLQVKERNDFQYSQNIIQVIKSTMGWGIITTQID